MQRQQAVLAVERAQRAFLRRQLQHAEDAVRADRHEVEAAIAHQQHGARDRRQVPRLGALQVVVHQLGDLPLDHRPLVGLGAVGDLAARARPS